MTNKYDKYGNPLELVEWGKLMEDFDYKRVGLDEKNDIRVSTVWLGLDHSFGQGKPLMFESMVFGLDDEVQERYSTLEEAEKGHKKLVKKYLGVSNDKS